VTDSPRSHRPTNLGLRRHQPKQTDRQSRRAYNTGSKGWRWLREKVLVRDNYCCVMCGLMSESNHVDHIDGDSSNNSMENLRTLCASDHARYGKQGDGQVHERAYVLA
jgi:5-methylcytosine-specific restriction enzyme A